LLLGLMLAKRGADVLVLEGHETFDREFRGEVLQPSTAHLLDELGRLDYMLAQPTRLEAPKIRMNDTRPVGCRSRRLLLPILTPSGCRNHLPGPLLRKAEPFPSFTYWIGAKVSQLIQEDGCTVGVRRLGHGKESFEVRADVVVGADGRYSKVAQRIHPRIRARRPPRPKPCGGR
jgi:2-polyprenyl-6-methoxyphenol hydroxylase-like FAD-dependent oxidoreductase